MRHRSSLVSPYFTVFINTTVSICQYLNGTDGVNPILKWAVNMVERSFPKEFLHPCPYIGMHKILNLTIVPLQQVIQFPKGYYKSILRFFDEIDDRIAVATLGIELL